MPTKALDKIKLAVGRLLGPAKQKDRDTVEQWQAMMAASGVTPSNRVLELLAWDILNNGQPLGEVAAQRKATKAGELIQDSEIIAQLRGIVMDLNQQLISKDVQHRQDIEQLLTQNIALQTDIGRITVDIQRLQHELAAQQAGTWKQPTYTAPPEQRTTYVSEAPANWPPLIVAPEPTLEEKLKEAAPAVLFPNPEDERKKAVKIRFPDKKKRR